MKRYIFHKPDTRSQFAISVAVVMGISLIGLFVHELIGYRVIAFMLLVGVSVLATMFDIIPVLVAALLSALIWDYFFIPPRFTLTVGTAEDRILLLMYFIIAMINAVLTNRIKR